MNPTNQQRLALAQAITNDARGRYLTADNDPADWVLIHEAVASSRAFFVTVRPEILALDVDHPEALPALGEIAILLRAHQIEPVLIASGGAARRHLFARVEDPTLRQTLTDRAKRAGIDVRRDIRPPLTPHRSGNPVRLVEPATPADALRALTHAEALPALSGSIQGLLLDASDAYASNSELMAAIALGAVNSGWDVTDFLAAVNLPGTYTCRYLDSKRRKTSDPDSEEWLQRTWNAAVDFADQHPARRREQAHEIAALQRHAATMQWRGRTGGTDQAVYEAILAKAQQAGTLRGVSFSVREACERAGIGSLNTAGKSLRRLQEAGLITRRARPTGRSTHATIWNITPINPDTSSSHPQREIGVADSAIDDDHDLDHDVWRYGRGLGKTPRRIYRELKHGPQTVIALAERLELSRQTIRNGLRRLIAVDLATQRADGRYEIAPDADLDAAAKTLGINGRGEQQIEHHRLQREVWKHHLRQGQNIFWPPTGTGRQSA